LTSAKVGAFVMTALVVMYLVLVGERSLALIASEDAIGIAIGWFMIVLPVIAFWGIAMELRFGLKIEKLGNKLHEEKAWPVFHFETRASGRPTKDSAEAVFDIYRSQVESDERNWRSWFALGLAYDAAGDRSRARKAMRMAIKLFT